MRAKLTVEDKEDLQVALRTIKDIIGVEYPERTVRPLADEAGKQDFRWGIGDGFRLALDGLIEAALPGWRR